MEIEIQRQPSAKATTLGDLYVDGVWECYTLEDQIREVAGVDVAQWKIPRETAIPAGRYKVTLENSNRFGPDTITLNDVPGFQAIRMHGGNSKDDTEGCVLVGDHADLAAARISGAKTDHVLENVKQVIGEALQDLEEVWITIRNPA